MPPRRWSVDEFLVFDDGTDTRYELRRGELVALVPPLESRGRLIARLGGQLSAQLRAPCEPVAAAGIRPQYDQTSYYRADLALTCTPPSPERRWVEDPVLVAEVRSPSTEQRDLYEKLIGYQSLDTVRDILFLDGRSARIDHFARDGGGWRQTMHIGPSTLHLAGLNLTIDLGRLYDGLLSQSPEPPTES